MPSDQSTWLISVPDNGDSEGLLPEISRKIANQSRSAMSSVAQLHIPSLKTGTLESLIALSEELPKLDTFFTATVAKTVETLRNLLNNDPSKLAQHVLVSEISADEYLLQGWKWNGGRYGVQRSIRELVDGLNKEMTSIDNSMKTKLNNYNMVKGSLTQMQRKKMGNLSIRSLTDIVRKEHVITDSEYLETQLVAVPKNSVKEWNSTYEKLTSMIVPRSATVIDSDDEYVLYGVVAFKKVHDEFVQKCRERKFIVRDYQYSEDQIAKQQQELATADITEKELWTELLRLSRTNFSESFQILVHLKVIRLFVESVLQYGLPANYIGLVIKPEKKSTQKTLAILTSSFAYLRRKNPAHAQVQSKDTEEFAGEYQTLMDQEVFDFVMYEVPWIVF